jgi:spore maturation protein SpmB
MFTLRQVTRPWSCPMLNYSQPIPGYLSEFILGHQPSRDARGLSKTAINGCFAIMEVWGVPMERAPISLSAACSGQACSS